MYIWNNILLFPPHEGQECHHIKDCPVQTTLMYQINIVMLECLYLQSV